MFQIKFSLMVAKFRFPVKHVPIVSDSQQVRVIFPVVKIIPVPSPFETKKVWFQLEKSLKKNKHVLRSWGFDMCFPKIFPHLMMASLWALPGWTTPTKLRPWVLAPQRKPRRRRCGSGERHGDVETWHAPIFFTKWASSIFRSLINGLDICFVHNCWFNV